MAFPALKGRAKLIPPLRGEEATTDAGSYKHSAPLEPAERGGSRYKHTAPLGQGDKCLPSYKHSAPLEQVRKMDLADQVGERLSATRGGEPRKMPTVCDC